MKLPNDIVSREDALRNNLKFFFTGKPCKYGHISERKTGNSDCRECIIAYRQNNKAKISAQQKLYYQENEKKIKAWKKADYEVNKEKYRVASRTYYKENTKKALASGKRWRVANPMNIFIRDSLRRIETNWQNKGRSAEALSGYTCKELKTHIERQFLKGMTWANRGEWHIDHIVSINTYLNEGVCDPKVINALSNLRPLWAKDNISKGSKGVTLC